MRILALFPFVPSSSYFQQVWSSFLKKMQITINVNNPTNLCELKAKRFIPGAKRGKTVGLRLHLIG